MTLQITPLKHQQQTNKDGKTPCVFGKSDAKSSPDAAVLPDRRIIGEITEPETRAANNETATVPETQKIPPANEGGGKMPESAVKTAPRMENPPGPCGHMPPVSNRVMGNAEPSLEVTVELTLPAHPFPQSFKTRGLMASLVEGKSKPSVINNED